MIFINFDTTFRPDAFWSLSSVNYNNAKINNIKDVQYITIIKSQKSNLVVINI